MTDVVIPAPALAARGLPQLGVCPRHGSRPTRTSERTFYTRAPAWSYLLILTGLLVFVIVVVALRKQVTGPVPECPDCDGDRRRFLTWVWSAWGATVLVLGAAIQQASEALLGLGSLVLVAALVVSVTRDRFRVSGYLSADQCWLTLKGVHPTFVAASNAAQQAAVAAQQAALAAQQVGYAAAQQVTPRW